MYIALVEDRDSDAETLSAFLTQYKNSHSPELRFVRYDSGEAFLASAFEKFHLVFMDIYMGKMDGIETALQILEKNANCLIVFLTASREDIWRAVKIHVCFDYIEKKCLTYEKVEEVLNAAWKRLRFQAKVLEFYSGKQKIRLPLSKIQHLVSHDKHTFIMLENKHELRYRVTFSSLHSILQKEDRFLLCNRGILLNMDFITKAGRETFVMADGKSFPIHKRNRMDIMKKFHDYQFEKLNEQEV